MAKRHKMFLTGSERAETEHALGKRLDDDPGDPRFVLVDKELEEQIRKLPAGIPPNRSNNWSDVEKIREAERAPIGKLSGESEDESASDEGEGIAQSAEGVSKGDEVKAENEVETEARK